MELMLKENVENLGRIGDVVDVKSGYARNFLLPRGIAVPVNQADLAMIEAARAKALAEEKKRVSDYQEMVTQLAETSVTIEGRANEEGHLFGSVGGVQVAEALREKGFVVDPKSVRLDKPLREIGVFEVPIHLHTDVEGTVKVWVVQAKPE